MKKGLFNKKDDSYKLVKKKEDDYQEHGKTKIGSNQKLHGSQRARQGDFDIQHTKCPKCGHHKVFHKGKQYKCCKCKWRFQK